MVRRALLFAAVLLFPALAQAAVFYPETFRLDNGLEVVVVPNHLGPAVTQMVWYKTGSADEVPGKSGLAHYLEHLMFRGTKTVPPGAFSRRIAAQGGNDNAFTSYDFTAFHETVASDRLAMVMQMEADRMQNLQIIPATAAPELNVVLDERQQRTDNSPEGRFSEKLRAALMPGYPYGIPVIGWKPEIEKLTAADAEAWYKKYYMPNNAIVIISGDVNSQTVKRLAQDTYGKIPAGPAPPHKVFPALPIPAQTRLVVTDAGVEQPQLQWEALAPSYATQKRHEASADEVLSEALDSGEIGVLYRDLVVTQGVASGVDASYDPDARGASIFSIALTPKPGIPMDALERAFHDEMQALAKKGLDTGIVAAAKKRLERQAVFARDSLLAPGYTFGQAWTTGRTVAEVEDWPNRIEAVTAGEVNQALRDLASTPHAITGVLLPDANATPAARAAAQKPSLSHGESIR